MVLWRSITDEYPCTSGKVLDTGDVFLEIVLEEKKVLVFRFGFSGSTQYTGIRSTTQPRGSH